MPTYYETQLTDNLHVKIGRGTMYLNTERGLPIIKHAANKLATPLKHTGNLGILTVAITSIATLLLFISSAIESIGTTPTVATKPSNALLIPGVNDFIPLTAAIDVIIVLFLSAAIHETAHAILAYREGYTVNEWGVVLLLGVIPVGAYVKIPFDQLNDGPAMASLRTLGAGVLSNHILFLVTLAAAAIAGIPLMDGAQYYMQILPNVTYSGDITLITSLVFWTAFLNVNLAAINSLPIYGLDGGHMLNIAYAHNEHSWVSKEALITTISASTMLLVMSLYAIPELT